MCSGEQNKRDPLELLIPLRGPLDAVVEKGYESGQVVGTRVMAQGNAHDTSLEASGNPHTWERLLCQRAG